MNYKKAQHDNTPIASHGVKVTGISLMLWTLSGLILIAVAAWMSNTGPWF